MLVFAFAGTVLGWVGKSKVTSEIIRNINADPRSTFGSSQMTLLMLGCDEDLAHGGEKVLKAAGRADMILLVNLDFEKNLIYGVSIPRDTRCKLPGGDVHKLNAYHAIAKPEAANALQQRAVEHVTGVKVDRTIVINYTAFQEMVDAVGGVPVNIKDTMKYTDRAGGLYIDFKPGKRTLDGYDSMCYVRFRKDKGGDYRRTERQREFLLSFKNQVIKNIIALPNVIEKGSEVLDNALSPKEIAALANFGKRVQQSNIVMDRLPTKPSGNMEIILPKAASAMLRKYGFETTLTATTRKSSRGRA